VTCRVPVARLRSGTALHGRVPPTQTPTPTPWVTCRVPVARLRSGTALHGRVPPTQTQTPIPTPWVPCRVPVARLRSGTALHGRVAADTDTDTVGALSCASGQVAKWNGTAWACAADTDTDTDTDTVGALSCSSSQVALFDGAAWNCKTAVAVRAVRSVRNAAIETTDIVGYYTSVAIGDDGNPVISHYDDTNDDLELYVCADAACSSGTNVTLETTGTVGLYTSVAIGDDGKPGHLPPRRHERRFGVVRVYQCGVFVRRQRDPRNRRHVGDTRRLRLVMTATRSSPTTTARTTIWSCTCVPMRRVRQAPT
jgi:hypothetical protein